MTKHVLDLFSLDGRVIVLTGGAGNLGPQHARALTQAGAHVVLFDHKDQETLRGAALRISAERCSSESVDVTDEEAVKTAMMRTYEKYGRIDSLINNAAMNPAIEDPNSSKMSGPYESHPIGLWRKELEVNMTGIEICTQAVAPFMMEARCGSIVNIASEVSVSAYDWTDVYEPGKFKSLAYIASKHGVIGITRGWAAYLGPYGVRVNAFSPGGMQNSRVPPDFAARYSKKNMLGSMAQEGDYAGHIVFLCSDASARMTGHNLIADGGRTAW